MSAASYNTLIVDLDALRDNYLAVSQRLTAATRIMVVVKADAYGHGLVSAARAFAQAGAGCFGVGEAGEGVRLREAGILGEIVLLSGMNPRDAAEVVVRDLSPVVYDRADLAELSRQALRRGKVAAVHLELDVGMRRRGLPPAAIGQLTMAIHALPGLRLAGIMAHFPLADVAGTEEQCREHWRQFSAVAETLRAGCSPGLQPPALHIANSAALLRFPWAHHDLVRPGISLYGYDNYDGYAPAEAPADPANCSPLPLVPAMSLRSRILQVQEIAAGSGVSYGHRFITNRPTLLAVLPLGYAHGYPRGVGAGAEALIGGRRVPVRGAICMSVCMVEVNDVPGVAPGDEVVLLGRQGQEFIGADEIASRHGTISYEILCRLGMMNKRVYQEKAKEK
ncbi:MAG: alanine racemase [Desulfobulbaceae bacterium]|nr:MAG: alanine racemase [Desulfobulbaceae bacterium]